MSEKDTIDHLVMLVDVLVQMHLKEHLIRSHHAYPEGYSSFVQSLEVLSQESKRDSQE